MYIGIPNGRISTSTEPDVNEIKDQLENIQLNASRNGTDNLLMNSVLGIIKLDQLKLIKC